MTRNDVTEMIVLARLKKGLQWSDLAEVLGQSKVLPSHDLPR